MSRGAVIVDCKQINSTKWKDFFEKENEIDGDRPGETIACSVLGAVSVPGDQRPKGGEAIACIGPTSGSERQALSHTKLLGRCDCIALDSGPCSVWWVIYVGS